MSQVVGAGLRQSPLHEEHVRLGAKMTEFGGFVMPLQYKGIREEHFAVRNHCGLFDASHMGEIEVSGGGRKAFVNYLLTNDVNRIHPGQAQYSLMCQEDGGVVDDLLVMDLGDKYMLVVNASNTEKDFRWISTRSEDFRRLSGLSDASASSAGRPNSPDALSFAVNDVSSEFALLALQGPRAEEILGTVLGVSLAHIEYFGFERCEFGGAEILVSRTGYTGEDGFEILLKPELSRALWRQLLEYHLPVSACGLGSRDSLRLEMGYSLYGHELAADINPYEAGLGFAVRLNKDEFVGRQALSAVKETGPARRIVGLRLVDRGVPRTGDKVSVDGEDVGYVTSGGFSPVLEQGIALALVNAQVAARLAQSESPRLLVEQRQRRLAAEVTRPPFVRSRVKR